MRCGAGPIFKQTHVFLLLFNDPCVRFTIAAAFGNVHGVYKARNVVLKPEILQDHPRFFTSNMDEVDTFQNQSHSVFFET